MLGTNGLSVRKAEWPGLGIKVWLVSPKRKELIMENELMEG